MNPSIILNTHHERRNRTGLERNGNPKWENGTGTHRAPQSRGMDHWKRGEERREKEKGRNGGGLQKRGSTERKDGSETHGYEPIGSPIMGTNP